MEDGTRVQLLDADRRDPFQHSASEDGNSDLATSI